MSATTSGNGSGEPEPTNPASFILPRTTGPVAGQGTLAEFLMSSAANASDPFDPFRLQLCRYAMAARGPINPQSPTQPNGPVFAPFLYGHYGPYCRTDPRITAFYRPQEVPKPQYSYIGLIAMAILSSPENKLVLSDIYQYILENYPYFRARGPGWRNSIRHNLSLNDCFVKAGRSASGKGHYWAIHPANVEDFKKGDFRRRKAQRKVRKHMGLAVDDEDSPSPPPTSPPSPVWGHQSPVGPGLSAPPNFLNPGMQHGNLPNNFPLPHNILGLSMSAAAAAAACAVAAENNNPSKSFGSMSSGQSSHRLLNRRRQFDVASLLAPENRSFESSESDDKNRRKKEAELPLSSPASSSPRSIKRQEFPDFSDGESEPIVEVTEGEEEDDLKNGKCDAEEPISNELENELIRAAKDDDDSNDSVTLTCPNNNDSNRTNAHIESMSPRNGTGKDSNNPNLPPNMFNPPFINMVPNSLDILQSPMLMLPHNQQLFQQNPSLASLMILTSRYKQHLQNNNRGDLATGHLEKGPNCQLNSKF